MRDIRRAFPANMPLNVNSSGIYFVMGGKYTTYRAIAEEAIAKALPSFASKMPYAGAICSLRQLGAAMKNLKF